MNKCLWINGKEVGMSEKAGLTAEDVLGNNKNLKRGQNCKLPDV